MTATNSIASYTQNHLFATQIKNNAFRCLKCNKLLAKINSKGLLAGQIKCPRCGQINEV
tara:strand:- start:1907 stop:2083 length:177 start_codon:yes stop_codon:yes gene_type:complete